MKILTEKQRLKVLKELAAIRHIATHLIFEDDRKVRVDYVDKVIENVAHIAFDVCGEEAATLGMTQLMYQLQELDNANGTPMGYTAKKEAGGISMSKVTVTMCDCCRKEITDKPLEPNLCLTVILNISKIQCHYCYTCGSQIIDAINKIIEKTDKEKKET